MEVVLQGKGLLNFAASEGERSLMTSESAKDGQGAESTVLTEADVQKRELALAYSWPLWAAAVKRFSHR